MPGASTERWPTPCLTSLAREERNDHLPEVRTARCEARPGERSNPLVLLYVLEVRLPMNKTQAAPGTTNDDAPFQPGERVVWAHFTGTVVSSGDKSGDVMVDRFGVRTWLWTACDTPVRRVNP